MIIAPNATDVTLYFKLIDPAAGTPETGLTITDLDLSYVRDRGLAVKADLTALGAVNGAHEDNKAIQVDAANTPGLYRVDVPDAAFASGVGRVQVVVNGAAIDPAVLEVELAPWLTLITGAGVLVGATTAALIWAYATRTLTQSAAAVVAAVSGSDINITRGDTLSASLTGLGNISARTKLWLTVKRERQHTDAQSIIQVEETDGMLYLNGSLVVSLGLTAAAGSITVTDAVAGDITIAISAAAAALLQPQACYYDIQMLTAAGTVTTLTVGKVDVNADVTGAIA